VNAIPSQEDSNTPPEGCSGAVDPMGVRVAHELKNPLTAVKALVQLGLRNPTEGPSHERLAVVEREITRMQDILQGYLSSGRPLEEMTPEPMHLESLVADTLLVLSARADAARVHLSSRGDALVEGDRHRLEEALLNLVANGIEATPPGGEVFVEVRPGTDRVDIVVRDTGCGIPPHALPRLGTPFFTTRAEGTGLGVSLARSVIALHRGSLRYESEPGKGTTATVTLPRLASSAGDGARAEGGDGAA
jgi:two-component system, NtrC family, sensor histidine kinase HydH